VRETTTIQRERVDSPARGERVRTKIVEREIRSPSPPPVERIRTKTVEREIGSSPARRGTERVRIVESERQVRAPSPPSPHRHHHERETEIDIHKKGNKTEVDIHQRSRSVSSIGSSSSDELSSRASSRLRGHRRSRSAIRRGDDSEGEYVTSRIDSRGRHGEAFHGATKDWTIVDVPPGTERVLMDGVGGGAAEVTWQKYNGVRRSKFIPEHDGTIVSTTTATTTATMTASAAERDRTNRMSIQIYDKSRDNRDLVEVEKITERRELVPVAPPPPRRRSVTWTEITKDLVVREAIRQSGYQFEETEYFFYILQYLRYVSLASPLPTNLF
jgi:hypothetical protein